MRREATGCGCHDAIRNNKACGRLSSVEGGGGADPLGLRTDPQEWEVENRSAEEENKKTLAICFTR